MDNLDLSNNSHNNWDLNSGSLNILDSNSNSNFKVTLTVDRNHTAQASIDSAALVSDSCSKSYVTPVSHLSSAVTDNHTSTATNTNCEKHESSPVVPATSGRDYLIPNPMDRVFSDHTNDSIAGQHKGSVNRHLSQSKHWVDALPHSDISALPATSTPLNIHAHPWIPEAGGRGC